MIKVEWQEFNSPELGEVKYTGGMLFFNQNDEQKTISLDNKNISFEANEDGYIRIVYNDGVNTATAVSNEKFIDGFYTSDGIPRGMQTNGVYQSLVDTTPRFPFSDVSNSVSSSSTNDPLLVRRIAKTTTNKPKDVNFNMLSGGWAYINGSKILTESSSVGGSDQTPESIAAAIEVAENKEPPKLIATKFPANPNDPSSSIYPITAQSSISDIEEAKEYDILNCNNENFNYLKNLEVSTDPEQNPNNIYHEMELLYQPGYDVTRKLKGIDNRDVFYSDTPVAPTKIYYGYYRSSTTNPVLEKTLFFYSPNNRQSVTSYEIPKAILKTDVIVYTNGVYSDNDTIIHEAGGTLKTPKGTFTYSSYVADTIYKTLLFYRYKNSPPLTVDANGEYVSDSEPRIAKTDNTTNVDPVYTSKLKWKLLISSAYNQLIKKEHDELIAEDKQKYYNKYRDLKLAKDIITDNCIKSVSNNSAIVFNLSLRLQTIRANKVNYNNFIPGYTPAGGCYIPGNIYVGSNGTLDEDGSPAETSQMISIAIAEVTPVNSVNIIENGQTFTSDYSYFSYMLSNNLTPPYITLLDNALSKTAHYSFKDQNTDNSSHIVISSANNYSTNYVINRAVNYKTMNITQRDIDLLRKNYPDFVYIDEHDYILFKFNYPERWYLLNPSTTNINLTYQQLVYMIELYQKKPNGKTLRNPIRDVYQIAFLDNNNEYFTMYTGPEPGPAYIDNEIYFSPKEVLTLDGDVYYYSAKVEDLIFAEIKVNLSSRFKNFYYAKYQNRKSFKMIQAGASVIDEITYNNDSVIVSDNHYFIYDDINDRINTIELKQNKSFNEIFSEALTNFDDIVNEEKYFNHGLIGYRAVKGISDGYRGSNSPSEYKFSYFCYVENSYLTIEYIYNHIKTLLLHPEYRNFSFTEYAGGEIDIKQLIGSDDFLTVKQKIDTGGIDMNSELRNLLVTKPDGHKILEINLGQIKVFLTNILLKIDNITRIPYLERPRHNFATEFGYADSFLSKGDQPNVQEYAKSFLDSLKTISIKNRELVYCYDFAKNNSNNISINSSTGKYYIVRDVDIQINSVKLMRGAYKIVLLESDLAAIQNSSVNDIFLDSKKNNLYVVFKRNNVGFELIANKLNFIDANGNEDLNNSHYKFIKNAIGIV